MRGIERYYLHKQRTPVWADKKKINAIYHESKRLGDKFHVDHIVPLIHPGVCGLHCEFNLQIETAKENLQKGNNYWPDMWLEQQHLNLPEWDKLGQIWKQYDLPI